MPAVIDEKTVEVTVKRLSDGTVYVEDENGLRHINAPPEDKLPSVDVRATVTAPSTNYTLSLAYKGRMEALDHWEAGST